MKDLFLKGVGVVALLFIVGCTDNNQTSQEYQEANDVADQALEAILDDDYKTIYELSSDNYQKALSEEPRPDPNFENKSLEEIEEMTAFNPGTYQKLKESEDYIYGAYYGFAEENNSILYYLDGYLKGSRKTYQFELIEEDDQWKLVSYQSWRSSTVKDQGDSYVSMIELEEDDLVEVFHRGENYEQGR